MSLKFTERYLRSIRRKVFDYPEDQDERVARILDYLKSRLFRDPNRRRNLQGEKYARVMWM